MNTRSYDTKKIKDAYYAIDSGFIWDDTPQGKNYWRDVSKNLHDLAEAKNCKADCNAEIAELKKRIACLESRCC